MTTAWMLVVLLTIVIMARIFRSNKMLWVLVLSTLVGLVVGMMSGESVAKAKKSNTTEVATLTMPETGAACIQFLLTTVDNTVFNDSQTGTVGYKIACDKLSDEHSSSYLAKGRDQPPYIDDT